MRKLNLSGVSDSDLSERVRRFIYNNQYSLPISIVSDNQIKVMIVLEESDFRFNLKDNVIYVTN
jgi:hypothetical protein